MEEGIDMKHFLILFIFVVLLASGCLSDRVIPPHLQRIHLNVSIDNDIVHSKDNVEFLLSFMNVWGTEKVVNIEYWITDADNNTYYRNSCDYLLPSDYNSNTSRQAYIYSWQKPGTYYVNAMINTEGISFNDTTSKPFTVIRSPVSSFHYAYDLSVVDHPEDIEMVLGENKTITASVISSGGYRAGDTRFDLSGLPSPWYKIERIGITELEPYDAAEFEIIFMIPYNALPDAYKITLSAYNVDKPAYGYLNIYVSNNTQTMVEGSIKRANYKYEKFRETARWYQETKDLTAVYSEYEKGMNEIESAEGLAEQGRWQDARKRIEAANVYHERADELLAVAEYTGLCWPNR
jgi:hypothetical protein